MGYTVTRPPGPKEAEFQDYARLLRLQGVDLARVPRALEPRTGRRWLYVWDMEAEAARFAKELKKRTGDKAWYVEPVRAAPSPGPLGPIMVQLGRQSDGLVFGLHPLSRALVESAFPTALGATRIFLDADRWSDFQRGGHVTWTDLTWDMAAALTGLTREQLQGLGLTLIDSATGETLVSVSPSVNGQAGDEGAA